MTYRDAEKKYGIPKSTIKRKVNNKNMLKVGRPNILTEVDENNLVKGICLSSKSVNGDFPLHLWTYGYWCRIF